MKKKNAEKTKTQRFTHSRETRKEESDRMEHFANERLDEETARQLHVLAAPKECVTRDKTRPFEDFLFAALRCADEARFGALTIMTADPRWAYVEACIAVLRRVLDQQDAYRERLHAAGVDADTQAPSLLNTTVCGVVKTNNKKPFHPFICRSLIGRPR